MRALVISAERPVDVIQVPDSTTVLDLHRLTAQLDAAGIDYELLPVDPNTSTEQLQASIDRFLDT
jgi:hypothetical protein